MGARNWQRQSPGPASSTDGHGHQRHSKSALALALGLDGCRAGDRHRNSWRAFPRVRHRLLSSPGHHGRDVRRSPGAHGGRSHHEEKRRKRSQSRRSVFQRPDRGGRRLWLARNHHQSFSGPGDFQQRAALVYCKSSASLAADLFSFGPKLLGPLATSNLFGLIMFLVLAASLFYFARKKLD